MSDAAAIRVGNVTVGQVVVQENGVRGEGGPFDPRLMLPLTATMHPRPQAEAITLLDVTGSLHFTPQGQQEPFDENQVGPAVTVRLARQQMLVRSFPDNPVDSQFQLRIPLTQALVALLEAHSHTASDKVFRASLRLSPTVAWLRETGNTIGRTGRPNGPSGELPIELGMYSRVALFWTTKIEPLSLQVPASVWVEQVLPGLGYDRLRLIEVALPLANDLVPATALAPFDGARRDYDLGNYRECIEKCRYVRDAVSTHLGTTKVRLLGDIVVERRGLPEDAPQRGFLNHLWQGWWDMTNAGHHVPTPHAFTRADAHMCLMTTAIILEYLGTVR